MTDPVGIETQSAFIVCTDSLDFPASSFGRVQVMNCSPGGVQTMDVQLFITFEWLSFYTQMCTLAIFPVRA